MRSLLCRSTLSKANRMNQYVKKSCRWSFGRSLWKSRSHSTSTRHSTLASATHRTIYGPSRPQVGDFIENINENARHLLEEDAIVFSGSGTQLGLAATWRLSVRSDGAFREEIQTPKFTSINGYDGTRNSLSWSGDHTGVSQFLELDDHELLLLTCWVRAGLWASPAVRQQLSIDLLSKPDDEEIVLRLRLKGGRVNGMLAINGASLQPTRIVFDLRSDVEGLEFVGWKVWENVLQSDMNKNAVLYPEKINYESMSGTNILHVLEIKASSLYRGHAVIESAMLLREHYSKPKSPDIPFDSSFSASTYDLPAWVTNSGHVLVKASINGIDGVGYWLFDTGASGSVIDRATAEKLELDTFGSFKVKGMTGDLDGKFRQSKCMEIGPLKIKDMLMMEMDCSGLVRGGPGPVVGIIGCDVMARCVFDIPKVFPRPTSSSKEFPSDVSNPAAAMAFSAIEDQRRRSSSLPKSPSGFKKINIRMYDPRIVPTIPDETKWRKIRWVSSLPHLSIKCQNKDHFADILLMVDSGAGGMQLMLNGLTALQLGLDVPDNGKSKGTRTVRGVGGSGGSNIKLGTERLKSIQIGSEVIADVDCLVAADGTPGGVELSHYTGGVLCNEILVQYRFVVDLPRDRMALF